MEILNKLTVFELLREIISEAEKNEGWPKSIWDEGRSFDIYVSPKTIANIFQSMREMVDSNLLMHLFDTYGDSKGNQYSCKPTVDECSEGVPMESHWYCPIASEGDENGIHLFYNQPIEEGFSIVPIEIKMETLEFVYKANPFSIIAPYYDGTSYEDDGSGHVKVHANTECSIAMLYYPHNQYIKEKGGLLWDNGQEIFLRP